jgi:hypothetical protein
MDERQRSGRSRDCTPGSLAFGRVDFSVVDALGRLSLKIGGCQISSQVAAIDPGAFWRDALWDKANIRQRFDRFHQNNDFSSNGRTP